MAGLRWAFFGDSITNGSTASAFSSSFAPQAITMAGHLVARPDSIEAGTPGETSAQVLARVGTTLAAVLTLALQTLAPRSTRTRWRTGIPHGPGLLTATYLLTTFPGPTIPP